MRLFLSILLLSASICISATGDILAVRIPSTVPPSVEGCVAEIDIEGLAPGGTYAMGLGTNNDPSTAKVVFTVVSKGFDVTGEATTITRTLYGTIPLRVPFEGSRISGALSAAFTDGETMTQAVTGAMAVVYGPSSSGSAFLVVTDTTGLPDASSVWTGDVSLSTLVPSEIPTAITNDERLDGTTLTVRVVLSDYLYIKDKAGEENSGTDPTVAIAAGFYTQGTATAQYSGTVTNNSTAEYQWPVGNWLVCNKEIISASTFDLMARAGTGDVSQGRSIACMKFTAADQHSNTVTEIVTAPTTVQEPTWPIPITAWVKSMSAATLTQGDDITCNFYAYPWVGDVPLWTGDGVYTQPTRDFPRFYYVNI